MDFVANFIRFSAMQKCENRLIFDEITESIKVGTFLRHRVFSFLLPLFLYPLPFQC